MVLSDNALTNLPGIISFLVKNIAVGKIVRNLLRLDSDLHE